MGLYAVLACIVVAGCSFKPGTVPAMIDAAVPDAPDASMVVIDAIDADACQSPFTRTMHGCHAFGAVANASHAAARAGCQAIGGDLPIVDNLGESNYLATATGADINARVSLGLTGSSLDGTQWTWIDGQTVAQKGYNNWSSTEPNSGEDCAVIRPDGLWAGRLCTEVFTSVCERN